MCKNLDVFKDKPVLKRTVMTDAADRNRQNFSARTGSRLDEREQNRSVSRSLTRALHWDRCACRVSTNHRQGSNVSHHLDLLSQGEHVIPTH